jgi:cyanophycinase
MPQLKRITLFACLLILAGPLFASRTFAQEDYDKLLLPIGGEYVDTYPGFFSTLIDRSQGGPIRVLILPVATASNPDSISEAERQKLIKSAEVHQQEMITVCNSMTLNEERCQVTIAPIFVRPEAQDPSLSSYFKDDLSAVFILGGEPDIAMQVVQDSVLEQELDKVYQAGTVIAGTGGAAVPLSKFMLVDFKAPYRLGDSFQFGSVDVRIPPTGRGYVFGNSQAILDQRFFEFGRIGRLLNAISLPEAPHIGIGVDSQTGIHIVNEERIENVIGIYAVAVLDAETYHAAEGVHYSPTSNLISLRNVLFHLLPPGSKGFDLVNRQHVQVAPYSYIKRDYNALQLPEGAGVITLAGSLSDNIENNPVLIQFANLSGGQQAKLLIIAAGYSSNKEAQEVAGKIKNALGVPAKIMILSANASAMPALPEGITGIILTAQDQSLIQPDIFGPIKEAWLSGTSLLVDNAAAAIAGKHYVADEPVQNDPASVEIGAQQSLLQGYANIQPGLGLLNISVEPQFIQNLRLGRLIAIAHDHPESIAIGLANNSAIVIDKSGPTVIGDESIIILDLRNSVLGLGTNRGLEIINGLIDVFAPGEQIRPISADIEKAPISLPTPVLPSDATIVTTLDLESIQTTSENQPGSDKTPVKPTTTPTSGSILFPTEPNPPTDPNLISLLILSTALAVLVVFIGVWLNRKQLR